MTEISNAAASARESARRSDGRFGTQSHSEPEPLVTSSRSRSEGRLRRLSESLSSDVTRSTFRSMMLELREADPSIASVELESFERGVGSRFFDANGNEIEEDFDRLHQIAMEHRDLRDVEDVEWLADGVEYSDDNTLENVRLTVDNVLSRTSPERSVHRRERRIGQLRSVLADLERDQALHEVGRLARSILEDCPDADHLRIEVCSGDDGQDYYRGDGLFDRNGNEITNQGVNEIELPSGMEHLSDDRSVYDAPFVDLRGALRASEL